MTNLEIHAADKPPPRRVLGRACPHCGERLAVTWERQQALTLITQGAAARGIAQQLGLGTRANPDATAAEGLLARALDHLGAASRAQAVDIAYRTMLLPAPARPVYLTRALTDHEAQIVRHLLLGHSAVETAALLGIDRGRLIHVLGRLAADLGVPEGPGRTVMTVYQLHGARLLPTATPAAAEPPSRRRPPAWCGGSPVRTAG